MNNNKYDELKNKMDELFLSDNVVSNSNVISAYDLNYCIENKLKKYYVSLSNKKKIIKKLNIINFLQNRDMYVIKDINFHVNEDGTYYIRFVFDDNEYIDCFNNYINDDNIKENCSLGSNTIKKFIYNNDVNALINNYLYILNKFSNEFPNLDFEFFNENKYDQKFVDGILFYYYDINKLCGRVFLNDSNDVELAKTNRELLLDILDFYNGYYSKKIEINTDELNPLFKKCVDDTYDLNSNKAYTLEKVD